MSNERIDLTRFEGIMNKLFVGEQNRWRFAINEYTDTETMSKKEYEEWENGLESVWDSLTIGVACLPDLIAELKRCYEKIDWLQQVADLAADNIGRKNWDVFEEAMYEAGLWERPSE